MSSSWNPSPIMRAILIAYPAVMIVLLGTCFILGA